MKHFRLISTLIALCFSSILPAKSPSFGLEWGTGWNIFIEKYAYYICEEGYSLVDADKNFTSCPNLELLLFAKGNIGKRFSLGLYSGIEGIYRSVSVIPLSARVTWYRNGNGNPGVFAFADTGTGLKFNVKQGSSNFPLLLKCGIGHRFEYYRQKYLSISLNLRFTEDSPEVYDKDSGMPVERKSIRNVHSEYYSAGLDIAIEF